jgi:hypothetical protein
MQGVGIGAEVTAQAGSPDLADIKLIDKSVKIK